MTVTAQPAPHGQDRRATLLVAGIWAWLVVLAIWMASGRYTFGDDLLAYWSAWSGGELYDPGAKVGDLTFLYSPAFAQLTWPIAALPFDVVRVAWAVAAVAAFAWLAWPLAVPARVAAIGLGICSAIVGNLDWVIAIVLALAVRWPAAWSVLAMTRVTGVIAMIGLLAGRRWRSIVIAGLATALVAGLSFAVAPHLWFDWADVLVRSAAAPSDGHWLLFAVPPLWMRLAAAAAIATLAPRWPAAIVVAAVVGSPDIWPWTPVILLACIRISRPAPQPSVALADVARGPRRLAWAPGAPRRLRLAESRSTSAAPGARARRARGAG